MHHHLKKSGSQGLDNPSLFVNSAKFEGFTKLYVATPRLAELISQSWSEMHVLPNTMPQNFCGSNKGQFLVLEGEFKWLWELALSNANTTIRIPNSMSHAMWILNGRECINMHDC